MGRTRRSVRCLQLPGLANLELPGGVYDLDAWKLGYETLPRTVEVDMDVMIQVEALFSPEKDPDDERVWM